MTTARTFVMALALAALSGCAAPSTPGETPSNPSAPADSGSAALGFCDPGAHPDLRAPDGSRLVLDGEWTVAADQNPYNDIIDVVVRQAGDCVWIVTVVQFLDDVGQPRFVAEFHGRLDADFVIRGEFADVFPGGSFPGDPWTYGPFAFRVVFSGSQIELIEDREPGEPAPGCSGAVGTCPPPVHLVRPETLPSGAPSAS